MIRLCLLISLGLLLVYCTSAAGPDKLRHRVARSALASHMIAFSLLNPLQPVLAEDSAEVSKSFPEFVTALDNGEIKRVVFKGIRPEFCLAYFKDGTVATVKEGFPSFDDPKSPSGPAQAIAKVQHTPGVVCEQDIADVLALSKTRKGVVTNTNTVSTFVVC